MTHALGNLLLIESTIIIQYSAIAEHYSLQYHCEWRGRQLCIFAPTVGTGVDLSILDYL